MRSLTYSVFAFFTVAFFVLAGGAASAASPPQVGDKAPDFSLGSLRGGSVRLSDLTAQGPVALVVLRGYPGYQCPLCNRQVHDFLKNAQGFAKAGVPVVTVYPGPAADLEQRAKEFSQDKAYPESFHLLLDPDFQFTDLYGLRWNATNETAYPATFLVDQGGEIFFARVSDSHGGRTKAEDVLRELTKRKAAR